MNVGVGLGVVVGNGVGLVLGDALGLEDSVGVADGDALSPEAAAR
jgi:hypothetical protein